MGQSSNDVIPTAIHVSAALMLREQLLPALAHLARVIRAKESELEGIVKTGRTHLMDAMPLTLAQELSGWRTQIENGSERLRGCEPRLLRARAGRHRGRHRHQCTRGVRSALLRGALGA